jgi:hypothetical protein
MEIFFCKNDIDATAKKTALRNSTVSDKNAKGAIGDEMCQDL